MKAKRIVHISNAIYDVVIENSNMTANTFTSAITQVNAIKTYILSKFQLGYKSLFDYKGYVSLCCFLQEVHVSNFMVMSMR